MEMIRELKSCLVCYAHDHMDDLNIIEMGQVVDMIKDLCEVERHESAPANHHGASDTMK